MPELPEVEVVRRGLDPYLRGRRITDAAVFEARSVRRHPGGRSSFERELRDATVAHFSRRGKFLWAPLRDRAQALVIHLGMSGQALLATARQTPERHRRISIAFSGRSRTLEFVDQRMFGGMQIDGLVDDGAGGRIPQCVAHIARDVLDPQFDLEAVVARIRTRSAGIKHVLLDQGLLSGVGNIYADEALWRTAIHYATPSKRLRPAAVEQLLANVQSVMQEALAQGGTSFDSLYVNVNGQSGYFERALAAYGREGEPCDRCGLPIARAAWENRSSFYCPGCQPRPRR
jgi:formamidopyrimidine-DNA glycosylase